MGIELAKTTLENLYNDNFNIYKAFSTSEEKLYLSYVSSDSMGDAKKPSTLLLKLKRVFPNLKQDSDIINKKSEITRKSAVFDELLLNIRNYKDGKQIDKVWFNIYMLFMEDGMWKHKLEEAINGLDFSNIPSTINDKNVRKLYGDTLKTSVSRLESYQKCPFSFYLKYGLKLKEQEMFKLEALDTGTFMHDIIDSFFEEIENRRNRFKENPRERNKRDY